MITIKHKILITTSAVLILLNILAWQHVFFLAGPRYLKIDFLDIGQGDSIFIETPEMRRILVDGGPNASLMRKLYKLLPFWEKKLDVVILTHPDADHLNGLLYVLQKYKVDYVIWTGIIRSGTQYEKWLQVLKEIEKNGTKIVTAKMGDQIKNDNVTMDILHPFVDLTGQDFSKKSSNDTGIVSHLIYGKNSFLLTADISSKVEQEIIESNANVTSDVLKVPHHGSKYSSSEEFLQAINPDFAVISVGAHNSYGHPTPEVLQRLEKFDIKYYRSDINGDVTIVSDGAKYAISAEKNYVR